MPRGVSRGSAHAGQRDLLITIERLVEIDPDSDFPTEDWKQPFQLWASREYVSLEERAQSAQLMASAVVRWEVPYTEALDPDAIDVSNKRRVVYQARVYNIIAAEMRPRSEGRSIVLTTQAKVG
jgi:head-tail adaptor